MLTWNRSTGKFECLVQKDFHFMWLPVFVLSVCLKGSMTKLITSVAFKIWYVLNIFGDVEWLNFQFIYTR